jgi:hypothetical protein
VLGHSSDHLVAECDPDRFPVGAEVGFQLNYSALVRAMTSPYIAKVFSDRSDSRRTVCVPAGEFATQVVPLRPRSRYNQG